MFHDIDGNLRDKGNKILYTVSTERAVHDFMDWLRGVQCKYLVAHNNLRFDWPILRRAVESFGYAHHWLLRKLVPVDSFVFMRQGMDLI